MSEREEALFAEIRRDHGGLIVRTACAFTPEQVDRDDLCQEILVALWWALPQFNTQAKLSTYIYRVVLSTALNWKRSRRRYSQKLEHYSQALPTLAPEASPRDQERLDWLYARIHELPPVDRSLMLLSLDRVGYDEIAAITGMSESNVGVRLHRIKQHLIAQTKTIHREN
jgi:RNA polymerase sigma-70 factor, ECF subfamily